MIRYALVCDLDHAFEGWFGSSADYDDQAARDLVECPVCGSHAIRKQIMAPAVAGTKRTRAPGAANVPPKMREMMSQVMGKARQYVEDNFEDVGDRFAEEARAMHEGRAEMRDVYGEATAGEVKALVDDGVPVAPMPPKPPSKSELN